METFNLLEAFADGFGGWRIMDVLGVPLVALQETLVSDLMTLRHFKSIAERKREPKPSEKKAA